MKIINHTHWDTRAIAKLIYRVAQDELNPGQLKNRGRITIKYLRAGAQTLGWCYYGTINNLNVRMILNLPRTGEVNSVRLARTIAHELGHAKGIKHRDMHNTRYGGVEGWQERYAYAKDYPIGAKAEPAKPTLDEKRMKALTKAKAKVREWETAIKRANTMLKKWEARAKAIERRLDTPIRQAAVESPHSPDAS